MGKHEFKFDRQSTVFINNQPVLINVYKCQVCNKLYIQDAIGEHKITLDGKLGEEVE